MQIPELSPKELSTFEKLRNQHPDHLPSDIQEALRQATWLMANSEQWQVEVVASYLLEGRPSRSAPR